MPACYTGSFTQPYLGENFMTKEVVKHRKEEKKKPLLTAKEKKEKKQEKKLAKQSKP